MILHTFFIDQMTKILRCEIGQDSIREYKNQLRVNILSSTGYTGCWHNLSASKAAESRKLHTIVWLSQCQLCTEKLKKITVHESLESIKKCQHIPHKEVDSCHISCVIFYKLWQPHEIISPLTKWPPFCDVFQCFFCKWKGLYFD